MSYLLYKAFAQNNVEDFNQSF